MKMTQKEIEVLGWRTPAEMSALVFCPAAELLPVLFPGSENCKAC